MQSTQDVAIELAKQGGENGTVVVAEEQKSGRGRWGRGWFSLRSKALTLSFLVYPQIPVEYSYYLSLFPAVACAEVIEKMGIECALKWPNDILIDGKKVGGILVDIENEKDRIKWAVVGIGINVNIGCEDFPEELKEIATSISIESGKNLDIEDFLNDILLKMNEKYPLIHSAVGKRKLRSEWLKRDFLMGKFVKVKIGETHLAGIEKGIDERGFLRLKVKDGVLSIPSGEVEMVR